MKKFLVLSVIVVVSVFTSRLNAQVKQKLVYFYIENLTVESYNELFVNEEGKSKIKITYSCIPAKIIGVEKESAKRIESKLKSAAKFIQRKELTAEEAEKMCANQRSF